jgi:hypothetical protein
VRAGQLDTFPAPPNPTARPLQQSSLPDNLCAALRWELDDESTGKSYFEWVDVKSYESAGVWDDSSGLACLVIRARYEGEDDEPMHLLYEDHRMDHDDEKIGKDCRWVVKTVGKGGHLVKEGNVVVCNRPTQPPPVRAKVAKEK